MIAPVLTRVPLVTARVPLALTPVFVNSIVPAFVKPAATVREAWPTPPMRNNPPESTLNAPFTTVFSHGTRTTPGIVRGALTVSTPSTRVSATVSVPGPLTEIPWLSPARSSW